MTKLFNFSFFLYILATFKNKWLFQMIMKGTIVNFRVGMKTMYHNHMIVNAGLSKREEAVKLVGKPVVYTTSAKNTIKGKVASAHGNKGALRVIFEKAKFIAAIMFFIPVSKSPVEYLPG